MTHLAVALDPPLPRCGATGKIAWRTRAEAQEVCDSMASRAGERPHPFKCGACMRWHVGHRAATSKSRSR